MKKLYPILLTTLLFVYNNHLFGQCSGTLVWSDEFNGTNLDLTKWAYQTGNGCPNLCGWGNSEMEYYTNSTNNVYLSNGQLILEAKTESISGSSFSSGKIVTLGKASWTYGRFESRMRLPKGNGLWPAFWMLSTNNNWPMTGEIDIMENRGDQPNLIGGTLHYGSAWPNNQHDGNDYTLPSGDFSSEYHILAVEWDPNEIRWYVDSTRFKTETRIPNSLNPASTDNVWPWTNDFYIILNLAVGGWYTGATTPGVVQLTKPTFEVDYVRVYDISGSSAYRIPFSGTAKILPATIQAEEYDKGCGDAAYYDTDLPNNGNVFRHEKVDIEATTDAGGGYDVGWIATGEWLEYTVNVPTAGDFDFTIRASSNSGLGKLHIEMNGIDVTGLVSIGNTGGWQNWQNFSANNIHLNAGVQTMKVFIDNAGLNLNYIKIASHPLATGINYNGTSSEPEVYQNMRDLFIKLPSGLDQKEFVLYNMLGQPASINKEGNDNEIKLSCQNISPGVYFLKIRYGNQYMIKKILMN